MSYQRHSYQVDITGTYHADDLILTFAGVASVSGGPDEEQGASVEDVSLETVEIAGLELSADEIRALPERVRNHLTSLKTEADWGDVA